MDLSFVDILMRGVAGLIVGFTIGLTGVGGGALIVPVLILFFKMPSPEAVGTASLYAALSRMYAFFEHYKLKTINFSIAFIFLSGALPGSILAAWTINKYINLNKGNGPKIESFQANLKTFIACMLILSVLMLLLQIFKTRKKKTAVLDQKNVAISKSPSYSKEKISNKKKIFGAFLGLFVGGIMGATSMGAVITIPLLILFFGLSSEKTVGTSILISVLLTLSATVIYGGNGQLNFQTALIMTIASLAGVFVGSRLAVKLPEKQLKLVVTCLIFFATILMFI
ncbi:MAG: sulfite exporter TauE/SafE family protein [Verrucomicrobiota bacterium]|nr:sulfite exporter TauE/SafE family protein [Verrucomicrobiota bacterium]